MLVIKNLNEDRNFLASNTILSCARPLCSNCRVMPRIQFCTNLKNFSLFTRGSRDWKQNLLCLYSLLLHIYIYIYILVMFFNHRKYFYNFCINNLVMLCMFRHMFNIIFEWIRFLFGSNFYDCGDLFEVENKICNVCTHYYFIYVWKYV